MAKRAITTAKAKAIGPYSVAIENGDPVFVSGQIPLEPPVGDPNAGCDDGNACTTDVCGPGGLCSNTPIGGCP